MYQLMIVVMMVIMVRNAPITPIVVPAISALDNPSTVFVYKSVVFQY